VRLEIGGRALSYVRQGEGAGPALVLLHFFGGSSRSWRGVMDRLPPDLTCVAVDLPGFGGSDPPEPGCTVESQAAAVEALLDRLGLGRRAVVGHSMGGKIALVLAARRPEQNPALVLVAASPPGPEPGDEAQRRELAASHGRREAMEALVRKITRRPLDPDTFRATVDDHLRAHHRAWSWWLQHGVQEDLSALAARVRSSALLLSGGADPVFKPDLHRMVAARLPHARQRTIPEVGHLLPLEAPDQLAAILQDEIGRLLGSCRP